MNKRFLVDLKRSIAEKIHERLIEQKKKEEYHKFRSCFYWIALTVLIIILINSIWNQVVS